MTAGVKQRHKFLSPSSLQHSPPHWPDRDPSHSPAHAPYQLHDTVCYGPQSKRKKVTNLPVVVDEPRLARLELEEHVLVEGCLAHGKNDRSKRCHLSSTHKTNKI